MSAKKALRFAPAIDGVAVASVWRVWVQGQDFYVANRSLGHRFKMSFHPHGAWSIGGGQVRRQMGKPYPLHSGWAVAVQLAFLIGAPAFKPIEMHQDDKVMHIPIHPNERLQVTIIVNPTLAGTDPIPTSPETIWTARLRGSGALRVDAVTMPLLPNDRSLIQETAEKLQIPVKGPRTPDPIAGDVLHCFFGKEPDGTGNFVAIVPIGPASVVWEEHRSGQETDQT